PCMSGLATWSMPGIRPRPPSKVGRPSETGGKANPDRTRRSNESDSECIDLLVANATLRPREAEVKGVLARQATRPGRGASDRSWGSQRSSEFPSDGGCFAGESGRLRRRNRLLTAPL